MKITSKVAETAEGQNLDLGYIKFYDKIMEISKKTNIGKLERTKEVTDADTGIIEDRS